MVAEIRLLLAVAVNANVNEYENGREIRQPIVSARFQSKKRIVESTIKRKIEKTQNVKKKQKNFVLVRK